MKRLTTIIALSTSLIAAPAMAEHGGDKLLNKENVGGAIGATVGGYVGSKIVDGKGRAAASAAGAVGGFLLGRNVAKNYGGDHRSRRGRHWEHRASRGYQRPRLHPVNETFVARTTSNVRAGPSTRFAITGRLHDHERVHVLGKVRGRNWFMVRDRGRRGFVYAPLLRPYRHYDHDRAHSRDRGYGHGSYYSRRDDSNGGARAGW